MYSGKIFSALFAAALGAGLLFLPAAATSGAIRGLEYCLTVLVSSLFPFMTLFTYLVKPGTSDAVGKFLGPVTGVLFRLPSCTVVTTLMSMVGGFLVGVRGTAALHQQGSITDRQATRMASLCVNAGPVFVISVVEVGLPGNLTAGALLLCAQLGASILLGFLLRFSEPRESLSTAPAQKDKYSLLPLIDSTVDAAKGTMNLCAFMISSSVLIALLCEIGAAAFLAQPPLRLGISFAVYGAILSVVMEATGGCFDIAALGGNAMLPVSAMSRGGLCARFQVLSSLTKIPFSRSMFFAHQLIKGIFSTTFAIVLFQILPQAAPAFENTSRALNGELPGTPAAAAALVVLCIVPLCPVGAEKLEFWEKSCCNSLKA